MTFTYDPDDLATDDATKVRFLIGDTVEAKALLSDEEITFLLDQYAPGIYGPAIAAIDIAIINLARLLETKSVGPLSLGYGDRSKKMADARARLVALSLKGESPLPYAGGISVADKEIDEDDSDISKGFKVGMMDNPGGARDGDFTDLRDRNRDVS